jgi:hypothetical protein
MFMHVNLKGATALAVAATASLMLTVGASASPAPTLTFGSSHDGASAGWSQGKGSAIDLTIGTSSGSFAEVRLHQAHGSTVGNLSAPSFTTDNYGAGSPRYFITLDNGDTLWGYPSNAGLNGGTFAWAIDNGNTYMSWAQVQAAEGIATVTNAYVIADADQPAGTVDRITGLTFGDIVFN